MNHGREGFHVINAIGLGKAMSNEACFVMSNRAIGVVLKGVHPFASHDVGVR